MDHHKGTIYSVHWAPTSADVAAATAAAARGEQEESVSEAGARGGLGTGTGILATGAGDDALRVFFEEGSGDGSCFSLDVEVQQTVVPMRCLYSCLYEWVCRTCFYGAVQNFSVQ